MVLALATFSAAGAQIATEHTKDGVIRYTNKPAVPTLADIEKRLEILERTVSEMVQATTPENINLYQTTVDPTVPGDMMIIKSVTELDNCDSAAQWSVISGAGVTVSLDTSAPFEGSGCVDIYIPANTTAKVKCTKSSGSWDLSVFKYLRWNIRNLWQQGQSIYAYFGEVNYNEQTSPLIAPPGDFGAWYERWWNISGVAAGSRNGVTIFALQIQNVAAYPMHFYVDHLRADSGPSQIKIPDGDRLIILYPKVYPGSYTGNGADNTEIDIPRKGTPAIIFIKKYNDGTYPALWWHKSMPAGYSEPFGFMAVNAITTGIKWVMDGNFGLGTHALVNANGVQYNFFAIYED